MIQIMNTSHLDACSIATQDLKNWLEENNIPLNILLVGVNPTKVNLKIPIDFIQIILLEFMQVM